jgi:hypothetical protein
MRVDSRWLLGRGDGTDVAHQVILAHVREQFAPNPVTRQLKRQCTARPQKPPHRTCVGRRGDARRRACPDPRIGGEPVRWDPETA